MLRLCLFVMWLCVLGIGNVTASDFQCDFRWRGNSMWQDYKGSRIDEGSRHDCPSWNSGGQCVALVKCLCGLPATSDWRAGERVKDSCYSIPRFTPIATFTGNDGTYISDYGKGHAAIFLECVSDGIKVLDQYCEKSIGEEVYWKGHDYYDGFYTIACPFGGNPYPQSYCKLDGEH